MSNASELIRLEAKKGSAVQKLYFFLKPEGLVICKDQTGKSQVEMIPYKTITCVNPLGRNAFFFKSPRSGYALFFNGFVVEDAFRWSEALIVLIDRDTENKEEIKLIDITEGFPALDLAQIQPVFTYCYSKCLANGVGKKEGQGVSASNVSVK